jgi:ATP-dependent Lhr-like helicase
MSHPLASLGRIADHPALEAFSPAVREWFASSFPTPTPPQVQGWPHIAALEHTLICAPTGSGKTLTAFLASIDRLVTSPTPAGRTHRTRVLYVSPLRALAFDIEKNLRAPLTGIGLAAERIGAAFTAPEVAMRTGDTPSNERQKLIRRPPDLLITTPESLYLMLTSSARETLQGVETVIIDEIHAMATTKRGAHLALTLERLEEVTDRPPQRIGLSATQRPLEETARFLGGHTDAGAPRPVRIVDTGVRKQLEVDVIVPVDDMSSSGDDSVQLGEPGGGERRSSIWPSIYPRVLDLVLAHRSTIIFCNARRAAERMAAKLNELHDERNEQRAERASREAWSRDEGSASDESHAARGGSAADDEPAVEYGSASDESHAARGGSAADDEPAIEYELVRAHHGSLAREQRIVIEDQLKRGELRAIVATSSLELGIDMGAVDLVIQVESPGAVSRGLQRIGRAGHQVGQPSKGSIFPKHRGDLIEAAVVTRRMLDGEIEHSRYLRNPLDVLAQQIVAHTAATGDVPVAELAAVVRRSANFHELSDELLANVLDLLAGRYPSEEFSELRPRIVWDRVNDVVRARDGAKRLAVTSGGTIPDRGLFGVFLPDGTRVGELDEEMVYESRPGETFLLGASTWRIEDISFERVTVTPAPGVPGKMPFWHGDRPGRPLELGRALGAFVREVRDLPADRAIERLREHYALDELAASNVVQYLDEQTEATGAVPDDRTIVVERFRDEIGDWRVCVLSPFGTPIHAPWAMAIERRLIDRYDLPVETMWGDDGIVIRLPEAADELDLDVFVIEPDEIDELVVSSLPQTSLFSARFRECAGRALLLPRRRPDQRTPLWQQRQRAADLLSVASKYPTFPILLETSRECLQDVFDVPALREVLGQLQARQVRLVRVDTATASPMASSLLFNWIAQYMYEGDAPLAERRAAALALDRDLLRELLGAEELRELLDPGVLADVELELQCLTDGRRARSADELHDVLRKVGDLTAPEIDVRCESDSSSAWLAELVEQRRAIEIGVGDQVRFAAADDAAKYRDALGCSIPLGLPMAFTDPVARPLEELVGRFARTHGPFHAADVARRFAAPIERIEGAIAALADDERVVLGEFRPDGVQREWCDVDVLRQLRRRSLAVLRREVEPVEQDALGRFLPAWHGIPADRRGADALVESLGLLAGAPIVLSTLEHDVLPARIHAFRPPALDELCTSGEVVWIGAGSIGARDGRIRLCFADQAALLAPGWESPDPPDGQVQTAIRDFLATRGASFWGQLREAAPETPDAELLAALWDLVWAGEVTNDSLAPLRAYVAGGVTTKATKSAARRSGARPRPGRLTRLGPPAGAGRWSLVAPLLEPAPSPTEAAHAQALQLLERYGVVTREAVLAEGVQGGYAAVYGVLKVLEERGRVRRGYFVAGLGAAQFTLPGAVDRLRAVREPVDPVLSPQLVPPPVVLAATDPAQPYGAALAWPDNAGRPARTASALVVLRQGEPLAWFDRRGHHVVLFPAADRDPSWAVALADLVTTGRERTVEVRKVDGEAVPDEVAVTLRAAGFADGYRGLIKRG